MRNPTTSGEWQQAVNLASALLLIDSAKQYGLVHGGPEIDVPRCEELLQRGRELQVLPVKAGVDAAILGFSGSGE